MTKPKPFGLPKFSYNKDTLDEYCKKNNITITNNIGNKINRDTKIEGNCSNISCTNKFCKTLRSLLDNNGYCKLCIQEKINIERSRNLHSINKKQKETCIKKYGVNSFFESDIFKNKAKDTWNSKYNCDNPIKSNFIIEKRKKLFMKKHGVENPSQLEFVKNKKKLSCLQKYGVEYPNQVPEIAEKTSKNSYKKKIYILPSGKEIICQGYEPFALDKLVKEDNISEDDIITGCKNVPTIWYDDEQCKKHRHYVDIFIPSQNRCIEVKSTWTTQKNQDNIYLKQEAAKQLGYNYEIWVYNSKKKLVEVKI
jgi:hypothetical protein